MEAKFIKLEAIEKRYLELNDLLVSEEVISNPKLMLKYGKEAARLKETYEAYNEYKSLNSLIKESLDAIKEESDLELKEILEAESIELKEKLNKVNERLDYLLIPKDVEDNYDAIVEIRGAAGGDEGNIFAGDLYRMYSYYAQSLGFKLEVLEASESAAGGYTLISFLIKGEGAYRYFKFESGSHRVQRVPKTEAQGRVHTSTATVLVLPDIEDDDIEIPDSELQIETHRASGAGGQHINKTDSAVRITHIPTGISVNCQDGRSQLANKETALKLIRSRVYEEIKRQKDEELGKIRKSKIGSGDRSEKIRTYNYPQNRVTDHRIGLTINQLDRIIEGKLNDIIDALHAYEIKEKLLNDIQ